VASPTRRLFSAGATVCRTVPLPVSIRLAERLGGRVGARLAPEGRDHLAHNLRQVRPDLDDPAIARLTRRGLASYARYWVESCTLPTIEPARLDDGFSFLGYDHIVAARRSGVGPIVTLPHLGGWEWAAAWLTQVAEVPVTAVVESLEPADVFEWFLELREAIGIQVVPLGPRAAAEVARAVLDGHVVCLVADRDLTGGGVPVQLFGRETTLPAGPALLARRLGAPLLPTSVEFRRHDRLCRVGAPLDTAPRGTIRDDVNRITQDLARAFEDMIRAAPDQWHVLAPAWPEPVS
jgi:phosphatidylinositol dimannoside acyltransferase